MAGLLWVSDRLYRMLEGQGKHGKIFCFTASSISASVGALVFTWPLAAYYFGTLVLVSPLSNLLCLWAASRTFLTGLLTLGVSVIWLPLGTLFGLVPRLLIAYLLRVAHGLASLPLSCTVHGQPVFVAVADICLCALRRRISGGGLADGAAMRWPRFLAVVTLAASRSPVDRTL